MTEDLRCCGTGTCLINAEGICWCGQQWDGTKMCFPDKPQGGETAFHDNSHAKDGESGAVIAAPQPEIRAPNRST